ncbi:MULTISPECIES: hypothetical protein [Paenibacillus]|uniref:hypothetical protein n=1 Tax=Paenibacillus TaxID=44249 RepID=UPI00020D74C4|nr:MULTISPECIES: hypothetical protein [Paenibacillus]EGL13414.1 hypothetical protein HMPREF9413_4894 [Paenibacillus sp. HGF7]EPD81944.1 hypothetical protein HMPREF1207_03770 [Paenibacillus sp. HGH0039]MBV6713916.1 hypothetical protein [Paenibacillus chitinolyticus]
MKIIPRYDEDFFNCVESHYVSYWKAEGIPVEYMFYGALEDTGNVYEHFVAKRDNRWLFHDKKHVLDDIHHFGLTLRQERIETFQEAEPKIIEALDEGKIVFFFIDGYYFKHRTFTYLQKHEPHCMMISQLSHEGGKKWFIQDHSQPDFFDYYPHETVEKAYDDNPTEQFVKEIMIFDIDRERAANPELDQIKAKFELWVHECRDDFKIYQQTIDFLEVNREDISKVEEELEAYQNAFFFLYSSRLLFSRFLDVMNIETSIRESLNESIQLTDRIRKLITNYKILGKISVPKITEACGKLYEIEPKMIQTLKEELLAQKI